VVDDVEIPLNKCTTTYSFALLIALTIVENYVQLLVKNIKMINYNMRFTFYIQQEQNGERFGVLDNLVSRKTL